MKVDEIVGVVMSQLGMACGMLVSEPSDLLLLQAVDWFFSGESV